MKTAGSVIRSIFGPYRGDLRLFVYAVEITGDLMFTQHIPRKDILVTKDIYWEAALRLKRKYNIKVSIGTASRQIQRLSGRCWEKMKSKGLVEQYVGTSLKELDMVSDILFYLAYYVHQDAAGQPVPLECEKRPADCAGVSAE